MRQSDLGRLAARRRFAGRLAGLALAALSLPTLAAAAQVQTFSPQGTVRDVRQVAVRFSEAMVRLGDPRLPDPFDVQCAASGHGRWADARNWVYDFDADLTAGLACRFTLKAGLKSLTGGALDGKREFAFATGGPAIRAAMPRAESESVDAEQIFLLGLDGVATRASIEAHGYCAAANLAERLPLQVLEGQTREDVLAQRRALGYSYYRVLRKNGDEDLAQIRHDELARREASVAVVRCARPLPEDTDVDLVWGAGIATAAGAATAQDQVLKFHTRKPFLASFSCERVNAQSPCVPVQPMSLSFTAPVPAKLAAKIRLKTGDDSREPEPIDAETPFVDHLEFRPPFAASAALELRLPDDLVDDAGRRLANAGSFPLKSATDEAPPLVKFAGEFGILEAKEGGVLPVSLRGVEDTVAGSSIGGSARRLDDDAEVLRWMAEVKTAMAPRWEGEKLIQPGRTSVFAARPGEAKPFEVARPEGGKAFELVGIPLREPGFYVVELASPRLGAALLGESRPRFVATTALVTNLSVHFKWGREGSLIFVSTLGAARPVAGAQVAVRDACSGERLAAAVTGDDGIARLRDLPAPASWASCDSDPHPLMVSARVAGDFAFTRSDWNEGISPYDFNLNTGSRYDQNIAHTVLDRSLLRAGETVSMKHFWREHTSDGLGLPKSRRDKLAIVHDGSGDRVELPLSFDANGVAETRWQIPQTAKLGSYRVSFEGDKDETPIESASFRVEQYRVPLMRALITAPEAPAIAVKELPLDLYVGYFSGGGAPGLQVKLRTQLQSRAISFPRYDGYTFDGDAVKEGVAEGGMGGYFDDEADASAPTPAGASRTLPLTLDANGAARSRIDELPLSPRAQTLVTELEYPDANGELTSVRNSVPLWPAALVVGLSTDSGARDRLRFSAVVLDLKGQPLRDRKIGVALYSRKTHSYRKRLVGGFYAYSHSTETRRLRQDCSGRTDANGLLFCEVRPDASGEIVLEATSEDDSGRMARAVQSAYVAGEDEWWFAQGDSDRMDLIPARRELEPGEKLRLQVRMPFRAATALVTVEREGVIDAFTTEISGKDPVIEVPMLDRYAPNVFVSVLALRPRVSDFKARFYDFLRWLHLDRWLRLDAAAPTALTDLSRPSYRLGITAVDVGWRGHRLDVSVKPRADTYQTRGTASVDVEVRPATGGALPSSAEIAFSAVDEALLDLLPNDSVRLLDAMMQRRGIEVFTSTAQMQVVGKRHYGRKSLAPGGGGGRGAPREMLNSLLLWKGRVPLDAQGHASVAVPLNDALTSFRLTAVASAGLDRFGEGHASIRTTQDVQLLSGLAPLVREQDRFEAIFNVRNTTAAARSMTLTAEITADGGDAPQTLTQPLDVPANGAAPARFEFVAPFGATRLAWTVTARGADHATLDALKVAQDVVPAVPVRTWQATLLQLKGHEDIAMAAPRDALVDHGQPRGGVRVQLAPSLTASLESVRDWMRFYPYACLEQQASQAIATGDRARWDQAMASVGTYLDGDGLARYFPVGELPGSDTLTAYLLQLADASGWSLPENERDRMLQALARFAEGKLPRALRVNDASLIDRKLAAIEALSRYGQAKTPWLSTITVEPNLWRTSALIDWIGILQRLKDAPQRDERLAEAKTVLRSRYNLQGTSMGLSAEKDSALWWLMISADVNAVRTVLALLPESDFEEDLPKLVRGAVGRQQRGHWNLTTANAWGTLALQAFAQRYEREPVAGDTRAALGEARQQHAWTDAKPATLDLPWPATSAPDPKLSLDHEGSGAPWVTVQSRAAVPLREPFSSGYRITRTVTPVEQKTRGVWTRGDVARVKIEIDAQSDMTWVVVDDPIPGGATLLGTGLGRDSALLAQGERETGDTWPAFTERRFDFYRAYYAFVPKGRFSTEYSVRYNTAGHFGMPPTHVEAMYAPEMLGDAPNAAVEVVVP